MHTVFSKLTMKILLILSFLGFLNEVKGDLSDSGPFPSSYAAFSAGFTQPPPPAVVTELRGHFIQHKWDNNLSHITSGYWYNSARQGKVRADEAYDGEFASSLFDYTNVTAEGQVLNKLRLVGPSVGSSPTCFVDHIQSPGFPLVTTDLLITNDAVFGGVVNDPWVGYTQSWNFLYASSISVTAYLDKDNLLMGFDFWGANRRTKVLTRFFNTAVGKIDAEVFENFPC